MPEFAVSKRNRRALDTPWLELSVRTLAGGEREKRCPECCEWLPMTEEFFGFIMARGHFRAYCYWCEASRTRERRHQRRQAGKASAVLVR